MLVVYLFDGKYFELWYCRQKYLFLEVSAKLGCILVSSFEKPAKPWSKLLALFDPMAKLSLT